MSNNCIVIPIYKEIPNDWEKISFAQCLKILYKHPICILTYKELDTTYYRDALDKGNINYSFEYFDKLYFENIIGYNFLMTNKAFYDKFAGFNSILIYQLDCFVFRDDLDYWAEKKFDYMGSPLFANFDSFAPNRPFWFNGNGGFSLRNIHAFQRVYNWKLPLRKMARIRHDFRNLEASKLKKEFLVWAIWLGYHNRINYFWKRMGYDQSKLKEGFKDGLDRANEDILWITMFRYTRVTITTPDFEDGLGFSFEKSPKYLYQKNNNTLPFGCHGWWKYELEFWRPFIEEFGYKLPQSDEL